MAASAARFHRSLFGAALHSRDLSYLNIGAPVASFHPDIELDGERTQVLCELIGAGGARNHGEHVGHLNHDEMGSVDDALSLVLDIT